MEWMPSPAAVRVTKGRTLITAMGGIARQALDRRVPAHGDLFRPIGHHPTRGGRARSCRRQDRTKASPHGEDRNGVRRLVFKTVSRFCSSS